MDYYKILGLQKEPFSNSPDPNMFYPSKQHISILQMLEISIRLKRGLNVVTGEVGTGKSTLSRQLIFRLEKDPDMDLHLILDPRAKMPLEFLKLIAIALGIKKVEGDGEWEIKEKIKNYLFDTAVEKGKTVVLIIDEAQNLPSFGFEILRELLNYETNENKLLQIIIFAQQEFDDILQRYPYFKDRINYQARLNPMNFSDMRSMIRFRLRRCSLDGRDPIAFSLPALLRIYRFTKGYPRKVINLCHRIMLTLIIKDKRYVRRSLVSACIDKNPKKRLIYRLAIIVLALALFFFCIRLYASLSPLRSFDNMLISLKDITD